MSHSIFRVALGASFGAVAILAAAQAPAPQGQPPAAPQLTVKQLKPTVYEVEGGGGNSTVIVGNNGVIVVDAKTTAAAGTALVAEIAKITPKPITTVIETHSDGDHVNGLAGFPAGVKVIAHENNKKEQEAALAAGGRGAPPADRLPSQVITKEKEAMTIDGVKFEFYHWGPAHTSGDLVVYLPDQKLVATGDIITTNRSIDNPFIHPEKNGSSIGWVANAKGMAKLDADTYVTGHGDVLKKADLQERATRLGDRLSKIEAMVKQGKTLDDIKAALPEAPAPPPAAPPAGAPAAAAAPAAAGQGAGAGRGAGAPGGAPGAGGGGGRGPQPTFTDLAYQELTKK
jgi:glyoxylase-like metal-dependent hydrolase (beta-lactamase superfamily II)